MHFRLSGWLIGFSLVVVVTATALADDEIFLRKGGKKKGVITGETPKGIALKSGDKIAAEDIDDILYDISQTDALKGLTYSNAFKAERDYLVATDGKKRAAFLTDALTKYQSAVGDIKEPRAKAHVDFKIAYLRGKKSQEDNSVADAKAAITGLRAFVSANPTAWELPRALILLAKLQNDSKDYAGAEQSFSEILKLDVSEEVKNDARLQSALANIALGKHTVAESKLAELLKALPKNSPTLGRVLVAQSECLIAASKVDEAVDLLKKAIKDSDDKNLRAIAYNTLGENYAKQNQWKEALWEFLWVDVVYNQDKNEHARALFHLIQVFEQLAEPDKAAQVRATLLEPTFAGTEYQRKLQKSGTSK
jgi:tetratricopeptide (TPR) repeat protein